MAKINIDSIASMSMREFLTNYVNLDNEISEEAINFMERNKATHFDLTKLGIPYVKRIAFEDVTLDDILMGNVLIVSDFKETKRHRRVAPYIRPELLKKKEEKKLVLERKENYNGKF